MIHLSPCTLNWSDLSGKEKSKFCSECSKSIPNLTGLSQMEILEFHKKKKGKLCGKVSYSQLTAVNNFSPLKQFIIALVLVFGTSLFTMSFQAQDTLKKIQQNIQLGQDSTFTTISGIVVDEENEPVPFCNVRLENNGYKIRTSTDFGGKFKLHFHWRNSDSIQLFIDYIGLEKKSIIIDKSENKYIQLEKIILKESDYMMVGLIYIEEPPIVPKEPDDIRKTTFGRDEIEKHPNR